MSSIKIGPKFFQNELRVYRDWAAAFWRENIQNSFDAGSTKIDILIEEVSDEVVRCVIQDNGCGMDRSTLDQVYFTLGETTKNDGDSVGGFGKARILTCFAQKEYSLHTGNLLVKGHGSDYTIDESPDFVKGVTLDVQVYRKGIDLERALENYLSKCYLRGCEVNVNGERWKTWTYNNKYERRLSFANVYTNKSKDAGVLVRVNGVHMFSPFTSAPFMVILEIDQDRSRDVLQSSRDGLLFEYQEELESFINELNINKQSALRPKRSKSIRYHGSGTFTSKRSKKQSAEDFVEDFNQLVVQAGFLPIDENIRQRLVRAPEDVRMQAINDLIEEKGLAPAKAQEIKHSLGHETDQEDRFIDDSIFNIVVEDDTDNPAIRKVIESYYPQNWDLQGRYGERYDRRTGEWKSFRAGMDKYKQLVQWKAACEYAIRLLQDNLHKGDEEISWGVGWCFSDHALAMHKYDGVHWLMLNPCKSNGNMRLSLSSKRDLVKMVSNACHEVCHIVYGDHDERFANLLNDLLEEAMADLSGILNYMKKAKEEAATRVVAA